MPKKLLIIEKSEKVRGLMADALMAGGYQVVGVEHGVEAARRMRQQVPTFS